jgi:hypothetical protein
LRLRVNDLYPAGGTLMVTKQKRGRRFFSYKVLFIVLSLILVGCGAPSTSSSGAPAPTFTLDVRPEKKVQVGKSIAIVANVEPLEKLTLTWSVSGTSGGSLNGTSGEQVVYTAGPREGTDIVVAEGTTASGVPLKQTVVVTVVDEQAPLPPTPTPEHVPTQSVAATSAPSSTPVAPNQTDVVVSVPPLQEVFPQARDGEDWVWNTREGEDLLKRQFARDEMCRHSGQYGVQLTYDLTNAENDNAGWGIHWAKTPAKSFDASLFNALTFLVKGTAPNGFQVGLKDLSGFEVKIEARTLTDVNESNWSLVTVPLSKFTRDGTQIDTSKIENVSLGFDASHDSGSFCIDEIAFK